MKDKTNGRAGATRIGRRVSSAAASLWLRVRAKALCAKGQGTTEYAILVGVPVNQDGILEGFDLMDAQVLGVLMNGELHDYSAFMRPS